MREIDKNELEELREKAGLYVKKRRTSDLDKNAYDEEKDNSFSSKKEAKFNRRKIEKEKLKREKKLNEEKNIKEKKVKNKKEKSKFSFGKFCLKLFIMLVSASFVSIVILYFVDRYIYNITNDNMSDAEIVGLQKEDDVKKGIVLEEGMDSLQYSYNNKYYTYLNDGKVYIKNIKTSAEEKVITAEHPICYYHLLYDKNLIYYITRYDANYSTYLQIFTYEMTSDKTSEYNEFSVYGFSRVKDIEYSPAVNIIYLNVERNSNGYIDNIIYKINLFNSMSRYVTDMVVNSMEMLQYKDILYFQDDKGLNYYNGYVLWALKSGADLMGVDINDRAYYMSSDRKKVYVLKGNQIERTMELSDSNLITWFSDKTNVYIIYPDYVIRISDTEDPLKKVGKFSKYATFVTIKGNMMYLKTTDNRVITTKLNVDY